jgi:biotin synthase
VRWLKDKAEAGAALDAAEALAVLEAPDEALPEVLEAAASARRRRFGETVRLCSIVNAKSGRCGEDCACRLFRSHPGGPVQWCASLGMLTEPQLRRLKEAHLTRYHHNLETAESYFPRICTTHSYADRVATVRAARRVGLEVCCGGVFGLGEGPEHRVELALALRGLAVDSVPLNFLVPIANTPAARFARPLSPAEVLKTIAMFRLVCPDAEIKVCAGRELHLHERERDIFAAGATGMMIGGYLTVRGRAVDEDLRMVREAGMKT